MPTNPRTDRGNVERRRRIERLHRVFECDPIVGRTMGPAQVAECCAQAFGARRRRHASEGSLHLALNDGRRCDPRG